jgi:peptide deformylase
MAIRPIQTYDQPALRTPAQPIAHLHTRELQQLIDDLIATTQERNGVGIAAPQVGESLQLMIVASHPTPRYPHAPTMAPTAMINPQILQCSGAIEKDWEGCLSVPGQRGLVPRHQSITVAYTDRHGHPQEQEFSGFIARIFQHEYDHFHGIVFLDRVESPEEVISEEAYQEMLKQAQK